MDASLRHTPLLSLDRNSVDGAVRPQAPRREVDEGPHPGGGLPALPVHEMDRASHGEVHPGHVGGDGRACPRRNVKGCFGSLASITRRHMVPIPLHQPEAKSQAVWLPDAG